MNRLYMLDTNTVSYIVKGRSPASRARLASLAENEIGCVSSITEAELHYGLARTSPTPTRVATLDAFFSRTRVLQWGRTEAAIYGKLRAKQEAIGKPLGNLDMLIAAHAVAVNAVLVTSDSAFTQVADLPGLENWRPI